MVSPKEDDLERSRSQIGTHLNVILKNVNFRAGEVAQCTLADNYPQVHDGSQHSVSPVPRPLLTSTGSRHTYGTHIYLHTEHLHTYTPKVKILKIFK